MAGLTDWGFFDERFASLYAEKGRPGVATRLMVGLHLLKHMYGLSDAAVHRDHHQPRSNDTQSKVRLLG